MGTSHARITAALVAHDTRGNVLGTLNVDYIGEAFAVQCNDCEASEYTHGTVGVALTWLESHNHDHGTPLLPSINRVREREDWWDVPSTPRQIAVRDVIVGDIVTIGAINRRIVDALWLVTMPGYIALTAVVVGEDGDRATRLLYQSDQLLTRTGRVPA